VLQDLEIAEYEYIHISGEEFSKILNKASYSTALLGLGKEIIKFPNAVKKERKATNTPYGCRCPTWKASSRSPEMAREERGSAAPSCRLTLSPPCQS
jgi:hypothetical protein